MKLLFVAFFGLITLSFSGKNCTKDEVYLCMGSRSYAYHLYKDCRAFDRCTTKIYTMTLKEAVSDKRRTLCNWCRKRK